MRFTLCAVRTLALCAGVPSPGRNTYSRTCGYILPQLLSCVRSAALRVRQQLHCAHTDGYIRPRGMSVRAAHAFGAVQNFTPILLYTPGTVRMCAGADALFGSARS